MTSIVETLYQIKYNPFKYGEYIASFYSTLGSVDANLLLAPIVIPLCSHPIMSDKISGSNVRSSIFSIFDAKTNTYDARRELMDLQERIDTFNELTSQSLNYCLINDWVTVNHLQLAVECSKATTLPPPQKSAASLGRLLSGHSVIEIYSFLGVRPQ